MTTYLMSDVRIFVAGQEIGLSDITLKVEDETRTLEINPQRVKDRVNKLTIPPLLNIKPVATYIGDPGPGKKKAQWKQEQRRFRK